jgi:hypothetical protein
MENRQIVTERVKVQVGGRIFEIPAERVNQLISMLESWKTIQVQETPSNNGWNGQTLLNG